MMLELMDKAKTLLADEDASKATSRVPGACTICKAGFLSKGLKMTLWVPSIG